MNQNKKIIIAVISAIVISSSIIAFSVIGNNDLSVSESTKNPVYILSNITKSNPNILIGTGWSSIRTTNINDVADTILITVEGTVLEVGDPIHWFESGPTGRGHGTVPITISVDQVYKGNIESKTFTFFINGMLVIQGLTIDDRPSDFPPEDRIFYLFPWEPQFEIGEKVLVHLTKNSLTENSIISSDNSAINNKNIQLLTSNYNSVQLGKYGKYQIQNDTLFNEKFSTGISRQTAINQSIMPEN